MVIMKELGGILKWCEVDGIVIVDPSYWEEYLDICQKVS